MNGRRYNPQRRLDGRVCEAVSERVDNSSKQFHPIRTKSELNGADVIPGGSGVRMRHLPVALALCLGFGSTAEAAVMLQSPWDLKPVKVSDAGFHCAKVDALPHDIVASDFYSDAKHSVIDAKRKAAYDASQEQFRDVTDEAERAADEFQKNGSAAAAACVMQVLETQAAANAMTGSMSSNQANYVQNWTMGGLAISYLKVRMAGPALGATPKQMDAVQAWMRTVGPLLLGGFCGDGHGDRGQRPEAL